MCGTVHHGMPHNTTPGIIEACHLLCPCRIFKVLKSKQLNEVMAIIAGGLVGCVHYGTCTWYMFMTMVQCPVQRVSLGGWLILHNNAVIFSLDSKEICHLLVHNYCSPALQPYKGTNRDTISCFEVAEVILYVCRGSCEAISDYSTLVVTLQCSLLPHKNNPFHPLNL